MIDERIRLYKLIQEDGKHDYSQQIELLETYREYFDDRFWGFEVPPTWMYAIEKFLQQTKFHHEKNNYKINILQIKEKFGCLRIYATVENENDDRNILTEMISYAKAITDHTCAECGKMQVGLRTRKDWISYLCDECFERKE